MYCIVHVWRILVILAVSVIIVINIEYNNILYICYKVTVSCNSSWSDAMVVERGVLQGDPDSPLIFNLCFNILMRTLNSQKQRELGYEWGGVKGRRCTSWFC